MRSIKTWLEVIFIDLPMYYPSLIPVISIIISIIALTISIWRFL